MGIISDVKLKVGGLRQAAKEYKGFRLTALSPVGKKFLFEEYDETSTKNKRTRKIYNIKTSGTRPLSYDFIPKEHGMREAILAISQDELFSMMGKMMKSELKVENIKDHIRMEELK